MFLLYSILCYVCPYSLFYIFYCTCSLSLYVCVIVLGVAAKRWMCLPLHAIEVFVWQQFRNFYVISILNLCTKHVAVVLFVLGRKINFPRTTTVYRRWMYTVFDKETNHTNLSPPTRQKDMCSTYVLSMTYLPGCSADLGLMELECFY